MKRPGEPWTEYVPWCCGRKLMLKVSCKYAAPAPYLQPTTWEAGRGLPCSPSYR